MSVFSFFLIRVEPFGAFKLPAELHTVTQGFVLFQMDRNVIKNIMHGKNIR